MDASTAKDKNILVIDDDITALDLVSYIFEDRGYIVHRATDGQSALGNLKRLAPKLIIVDLMMPGINGVETIRQVRQLGFTTEPIVAFTAIDDTTLHDAAIAAGANVVITKPCPTETLLKHVKNFLHD